MTCDEFSELLQEEIDNRHPIEQCTRLVEHCHRCKNCHQQFDTWRLIESAITLPSQQKHRRSRPVASFTLATSALLLISIGMFKRSNEHSPEVHHIASASQALRPPALDARERKDDPIVWIQGVHERYWVEQTMPTVSSFRAGVAPMGRSLLKAVTILTTTQGGQTT